MDYTDGDLSKSRWYALQVRVRHEKVTATVLRNKGYEEFLPLYCARRRWADRIGEVEVPLFPGYVFCHFDVHDRRTPILTTPGVIRLVGIGGLPNPIEEGEIAAIRRVIASGSAAEPWPFLSAGDLVRIEDGPLAGMEGLYVESKKKHKLILSVTLLHRSVAVEIDHAYVTPVRMQRPRAVA